MGFDPAYRTGCKIAVIDETGKVLDTATVYPTAPQNDVANAKSKLLKLIRFATGTVILINTAYNIVPKIDLSTILIPRNI